MRRVPNSRQLAKLAQLTRARKLMTLSALSEVAVQKRAIAAEVEALRTRSYDANTLHDAQQVTKWQLWRTEELSRRNMQMAAVEAEFQTLAKTCGRAVAENEVVERLGAMALNKERQARDQQM